MTLVNTLTFKTKMLLQNQQDTGNSNVEFQTTVISLKNVSELWNFH